MAKKPTPKKRTAAQLAKARRAAALKGWETRRRNERAKKRASKKSAAKPQPKKVAKPQASKSRVTQKTLLEAQRLKRSEAAKKAAETRRARKLARQYAQLPEAIRPFHEVADKYEPIPYEEGGGNPEVRKVRTQYANEKVRLTTAHKSLHIALESERKVLAARNTAAAQEAYLKQWAQSESRRLTGLSDAELLSQLGDDQAETLALVKVDRIGLHQIVLAHRVMAMREYLKDRDKYQQRAVDVLQSRLNKEYSPGMLKSMYKYINHLHLTFMEEDRATSVYDKIMSVMRRVGYGPLASAAAKSLAAEFDMTNREIFATFFGSPKV